MSSNPWNFIGGDRQIHKDDLSAQRDALWTYWGQHPWNWMAGVDPTTTTPEFPAGVPLIWTTDERDPIRPIKPFPRREYLRRYINSLWEGLINSKPFDPHVFLMDKARQMMASWGTLLYMDYLGRFRDGPRMVLSKSTESEAKEMLSDKVASIHSRLPEWVQKRSPIRQSTQEKYRYDRGGYILAVAENVADRESRGGTTTVVFVDEAARQAPFKKIMSAFLPACQQFIAVTTPEFGTEGANAFISMMQKGGHE